MEPLFVKVDPTIGAPGLWKILHKDAQHYSLRHVATGAKLHLYIGHTRQDMETKRAGFEARRALADTLGNRIAKKARKTK